MTPGDDESQEQLKERLRESQRRRGAAGGKRARSPNYQGTSLRIPGPALQRGPLAAGASFDFSVALPADAAPAYQDGGTEIWWELEARCDLPGSDVHQVARVIIAEGG